MPHKDRFMFQLITEQILVEVWGFHQVSHALNEADGFLSGHPMRPFYFSVYCRVWLDLVPPLALSPFNKAFVVVVQHLAGSRWLAEVTLHSS